MPNPFSSNKIYAHPHAIADWLVYNRVWPIMLSLNLTDRCNQLCPGCNGGRNPESKAVMPKDVATRVLVECANNGTKSVTFGGGGEPLMHPDAVEIIELAHSLGLKCGLITNGTLVNAELAGKLAASCEWIRVSLDAGCRDSYKIRHGCDLLADAIAGLIHLKYAGANYGVSYLVDDTPDCADMESACSTAIEYGAKYIQFKRMDGTWTDVVGVADRLSLLYDSDSFKVLCTSDIDKNEKRNYTKCHSMRFVAEVAADGTVYPCCIYKNRHQHALGNVNESTLSQIYENLENEMDVNACPISCRNHKLNTELQNCWNRFNASGINKEFV